MSSLPLVLSLIDDLTPSSIFDQHFGMGVPPCDRCLIADHPDWRTLRFHNYLRPWRLIDRSESGVSNVVNNKDEFKVNLDVQQFKPDQISVKVVDNHVVIEGKHEEHKDEHGFISRQFTRRYLLPKDVDLSKVQSQLSSDGVLSITAPKQPKAITSQETNIPIVQTNQPAVKSTPEPKKNQPTSEKMEQ